MINSDNVCLICFGEDGTHLTIQGQPCPRALAFPKRKDWIVQIEAAQQRQTEIRELKRIWRLKSHHG